MTELLDELYLTWLYEQIDQGKSYWSLIRHLYTKEFVWIIPNDDNRVEDGRDLRYEFLDSSEIDEVDPDWMGLGCSVLEMLIGLSRRLSFEAEGEPSEWFWILIENLDLERCDDKRYDQMYAREVEETLDQLIWRTYQPNGHGGLFPLNGPCEDQRDIEIWYQCSSYLIENEIV